MVLLIAITGALSGITIAIMKCSTELMVTYGGLTTLSAILFGIGIATGLSEMLVLNLAMKYYNQLEVVPIFQISYTVMNMIFGMVLLKEGMMYTTMQLICIFATSSIGLAGIQVLLMKESLKGKDKKVNTEHATSALPL